MPLTLSMPVSAPPAEALRQEFLLDPDVVFLNHGSFGATPEPVFAEYGRWQRELERQPVEFLGRRAEDLLDEARAAMAAYLGCARDDLVFVPNATTGINVVARSLPLEPGDEVVGTDLEYGACERSWEWFCQQRGARYVKAHVPLPLTSPDEVVEAIFAAVTPADAGDLSLPCHLRHGVAPAGRGGGAAGARGGNPHRRRRRPRGRAMARSTCEAIGVDLYASNFHKWLCAPKGSGFLYARPDHQRWLESPIVSWGWVEGNDHHRPQSQFVSRNQIQGTRDIAAFLAAPAAVTYQETRDWETVRERCHALAVEARDRIAALSGLPQIAPVESRDGYRWFRQMAVAPLPVGIDGKALKRRLYDEYRVEMPVTSWDEQSVHPGLVPGLQHARRSRRAVAALENLLPEMTPAV